MIRRGPKAQVFSRSAEDCFVAFIKRSDKLGFATVKIQYGCYKGTVTVSADENDVNETIIARAKAVLRQRGFLTLPMAYESYKVISRDNEDNNN